MAQLDGFGQRANVAVWTVCGLHVKFYLNVHMWGM